MPTHQNCTPVQPKWMQGFIPQLDKRNPHIDHRVERAVRRAKLAREKYLSACDRVTQMLRNDA
jgi:hypothetical protein